MCKHSKPHNRTLAAPLCALLLMATLPFSARAADPEGWAVTPLLPPDTIGVLSVNDVSKAIEKYKKTGLWQIYANPDIQQAFRAPLMQAQFFMGMAELQAGVKLNDIASWFSQGEVTFAILGVEKKNLNGQPFPDMLISVQAKSKAGALLDELVKRLDQLKAATNGAIMISQTPVGNTTLNKITVPAPDQPGGQVNFYYASCDGNILVSVGDGRLEKILAMREKFKAGIAKAAPGTPAEVLAHVSSYEKVREKAGPDNDLTLYVNVESILNNPILDAKPKNEREQREWEMAGLRSIRAISYCSGARDKGIRELFFIDAPAAARKGLLTLAEGDGLQPDALAAAPKNSLFAGAVKISAEKMLDKVLEIAAMQDPQAKENVNAWLLAVGQQLNLDVKKELFNALSGQGVFSVSLTARHPKLPVSFPTPLLALNIKNQTSLKNILKALRNVAKDNFDFVDTIVGDREIVTARERFPQGREAGQICYVIDKSDLIVSLYPLALRQELARRDAVKPTDGAYALANSLAEDTDFKNARAALSGNQQAMMYIDTGAIAVAAYDLLIPVAQLAQRRPEVDVAALPTSDFIMQNFGGTVFGFSTDADGILAEGYSPTGALSFLAAVPAAIQGRRMAQGGGGGGRFGGRMANRQQETMETIAQDLRMYAAENNGNFPAALKDMQPKFLANVPADQLDQIVYRGKQDAPNKVVAHTSERARGRIVVITQDGTVGQVNREMLGKVLKEGYTEQAAGVAPATGGAGGVKPPRPPEF